MKIIPYPHIGRGGLGGGSFQCRMGIDHAHHSLESRVRYTPLPYPAVMVGDIIQQPLDRVVGIATFIGILRALLGI
jgi:hypothetical protein